MFPFPTLHLKLLNLSCLHREGCSNFQGCYTCHLHYRTLQRALDSATFEHNPMECSDKFDSQITLNSKMITDLHWWSALNKQTVATPLWPLQSFLVIESDASQLGWGARCKKANTGGHWSVEEATYHINYLELLMASLALKTFSNTQRGPTLLRMDNISVILYKSKGRHSLNPTVQSSLGSLGIVSPEVINNPSRTSTVPGSLNLVADSVQKDRCEWMTNPKFSSKFNSL